MECDILQTKLSLPQASDTPNSEPANNYSRKAKGTYIPKMIKDTKTGVPNTAILEYEYDAATVQVDNKYP